MLKQIELSGVKIEYDFQYKNVKNINIRIKPDMSVYVSAGKGVPPEDVENFMREKADFITGALRKISQKKKENPPVQYRTTEELKVLINELCRKAYPYYEKRGIQYPEIHFRNSISRWGSCNPVKNVLMFSTNLIYVSEKCVEYVVWHEFTHFLQANHSKKFYEELEKAYPGWKECRKKMRDIYIP